MTHNNRACHFCINSAVSDTGELQCTAYGVTGPTRVPVSLHIARDRSGACGPEPLYLEMPEFIAESFNPEKETSK